MGDRVMSRCLFCFGYGRSARALSARLRAEGWKIAASFRTSEKAQRAIREDNVRAVMLTDAPFSVDDLGDATHILVSVPPDETTGDLILPRVSTALMARATQLVWLGYLSTTGVYGDHGGGWVDEKTPPSPRSARGRARQYAEQTWSDFVQKIQQETDSPRLHIFRIAGIYSAFSNALSNVQAGDARAIVKRGQVFSRIHIDDIATSLYAACMRSPPMPVRIYNLCDDLPAPPQDVLVYAASLLKTAPPTMIDFEDAKISSMARSFYNENKRVSNARLKNELGVKLAYPTYREGLRALYDKGAF